MNWWIWEIHDSCLETFEEPPTSFEGFREYYALKINEKKPER
jgi:hypothetical protein